MKILNEQGQVLAVGYFVKKDFIKGKYKETELDIRKKNADMLLQSIDDKYTLWLNKPIEVKGRGIKRYGRTIVVTERVYERLKEAYKIECDF